MSYTKLKYAWKSYGFCSEHGLGTCECLQLVSYREIETRVHIKWFLIQLAMQKEWWNDPLTWVVE